jgi:hypothetical protein
MNFSAYQQLFFDILADERPGAPYDDANYLHYVKLNMSRQQRWLKTGLLNEELVCAIKKIDREQTWTVITEPWCGDAAHTLPFIHHLSMLNPLIKVEYQLRDTPPFLIDAYLTNGNKSIPKLVIKDEDDSTILVWGPRPAGCQLLIDQLLREHADPEQKKMAMQQWYNADKGISFQKELLAMLTHIPVITVL